MERIIEVGFLTWGGGGGGGSRQSLKTQLDTSKYIPTLKKQKRKVVHA